MNEEEYTDDNERDDQNQNTRGCKAVIIERVEIVVDEMLDHIDRFIWVISADPICLAVKLVGIDDRDNKSQEKRRHHKRKCDLKKAPHRARTVKCRDFVILLLYPHAPRKVKQEVVSGIAEHENDNEINERKTIAVRVDWGHTKPFERGIEKPITYKKRVKHKHHRNKRHNDRHSHRDGAKGRDLLVSDCRQSKQKRNYQKRGNGNGVESQSIADRKCESLV